MSIGQLIVHLCVGRSQSRSGELAKSEPAKGQFNGAWPQQFRSGRSKGMEVKRTVFAVEKRDLAYHGSGLVLSNI
jgi:hypothetical protein